MATFPAGFTLHVKRSGAADPFGARTPGTEFDIPGFAAAPAGSTEVVSGQNTVLEQDTLYGPYDADLLSQDTVTVPDGQPIPAGKYQVDGTVQRWRNPFTGETFGCVVRLTRPDAGAVA